MKRGVDEALLAAWLTARSVARELPAPVADHGGLRVDTGSLEEVARWVFAAPCDGLAELGRAITTPGRLIKVCATPEALRSCLSDRWQVVQTGHFMVGPTARSEALPPNGYTIAASRQGAVAHVQASTVDGAIAASGYAAETDRAFIYDRIKVAPDHRRRGLGRAIMATLGSTKQAPGTPELLAATPDGRALYELLGWRAVSPYSTALIPPS